ncbi:hypothetical protein MD484_g2126, partial [Candolleomyces efflorescens]
MISRFAKSLLIVTAFLVLVTMLAMLHEPSRSYIDPWTGQFFGDGGVEQSIRFPSAVKNAKGQVIMPKLGNETAKAELGRATWKLMHTMTLRFPKKPTDDERQALSSYFYLMSRLYPCGECATEFQQLLAKYPPQTSSRLAASQWLCGVHNEVNKRLKKPLFDCAHVDSAYDCGCGDGDEDSDEEGKGKGKAAPEKKNVVPHDDLTGAEMIRGILTLSTLDLSYRIIPDRNGVKNPEESSTNGPIMHGERLCCNDALDLMIKEKSVPHKESMSSNLETYTIKEDLKVIERWFDLPLDYSDPEGPGGKIKVFVRHMIPLDIARTVEEQEKLPYLPANVKTPREIANYLKFFRADSIVKDCEAIRKILLGSRPNEEDRKWTILGQSYGGFVSLSYLSFHPEGLKESFITGGLAPVAQNDPERVYQLCVPRAAKRNEVYYNKYPADVARVRKIMAYLEANKIVLPNGGTLSPARFQQLGMDFGMQGGIDNVHQVVLKAASDLDMFKKLSLKTLETIERKWPDGNPLYVIMQEACYTQGSASRWAGKRALDANPQFSWSHVKNLQDSEPVYFTTEMMVPEMFEDYTGFRPWKEVAHILAEDDFWGPLYDLEQLARNEVKVSAVAYYDDIYLDRDLGQDTANRVKNLEQYITNGLMHDGIRQDGPEVLKRLFQLSKREYD